PRPSPSSPFLQEAWKFSVAADFPVCSVRLRTAPESRVEPDCPHADRLRSGDVRDDVVPDVDHFGRGQAESIEGGFENPGIRLADLELVRIDARLEVLADSGGGLHLCEVAAPAPTRVRDQSDGKSLLGERSQRIFDVGECRRWPGDD